MSFTNQTMKAPVKGKPHIAKIDGLWRVSPWEMKTGKLWYIAHSYANFKNNEIKLAVYLQKLKKAQDENHQ